MKFERGMPLLVAFYLDDLLIPYSCQENPIEVKTSFGATFKMKYITENNLVSGLRFVEILKMANIQMSQPKYSKSILDRLVDSICEIFDHFNVNGFPSQCREPTYI